MNSIHQIIETVQCEGSNIGCPVVLVRLHGCNCCCSFCDTKRTWNNNLDLFDDDFDTLKNYKIKNKSINGLMITGGEPTIHFHKLSLFENLNYFCETLPLIDTCELETNLTCPEDNIINYFNYFILNSTKQLKKVIFNISPKVQYIHGKKEDYKNVIIRNFNLINVIKTKITNNFINRNEDYMIPDIITNFKIVDEEEIFKFSLEILAGIDYKPNNVYLMPCVDNESEYKEKCLKTIKKCKELGLPFKFSPREQVILFPKDSTEQC